MENLFDQTTEAPAEVNINQLAGAFRTKKELYNFLVFDSEIYLPKIHSTNTFFYKQILKGEKKVRRTSLGATNSLACEELQDEALCRAPD